MVPHGQGGERKEGGRGRGREIGGGEGKGGGGGEGRERGRGGKEIGGGEGGGEDEREWGLSRQELALGWGHNEHWGGVTMSIEQSFEPIQVSHTEKALQLETGPFQESMYSDSVHTCLIRAIVEGSSVGILC